MPNLPIICDPSHIGGKRELVSSISQQALDMGFDGLIIESHCDPDCAWSDKSQQITPDVLNFVINTLVLREGSHTTESLSLLRQQIDALDNELLEVLNKRMRVSREIGQFKKEHRMPVVQATRYDDIIQSRVKLAEEMGMSSEFMKAVLAAIHEESVRQQIVILNQK
jgi:chorismate mutase